MFSFCFEPVSLQKSISDIGISDFGFKINPLIIKKLYPLKFAPRCLKSS